MYIYNRSTVKWLTSSIQVVNFPQSFLPSLPPLLTKFGQGQAKRQAGWLFQPNSRISKTVLREMHITDFRNMYLDACVSVTMSS